MATRCSAADGVTYNRSFNLLCVNGQIDIDGKLRRDIMAQPLRKRVSVVFRSQGGGMSEAIAITRHLERYRYDVIIDGMCASACAQFVFMGARHKYVIGPGIVAMHGGPIADARIDGMAISAEGKRALKAEQSAFRKFYRRRKIDIAITQKPPEAVQKRLDAGEMVFWAPKRNEFAMFGVRNVVFYNATTMTR